MNGLNLKKAKSKRSLGVYGKKNISSRNHRGGNGNGKTCKV
jgi:hypothetical protein